VGKGNTKKGGKNLVLQQQNNHERSKRASATVADGQAREGNLRRMSQN